MRYWLPLFIAVVLVAVVFGRAHPAGQICQETSALQEAAGVLPTEPLHKLGTKRLEALVEHGAPACAVEQLAAPGYPNVKQADDVPASVSGINSVRARLTNLGLDVTDWVLVVIAILLVLRTILAFFLSRHPGVVNVGAVTDAATKEHPTDPAIAAQIQQRLTEQHLVGGSLVPGGSLPEAVATTLKDTDVPNAKTLSALVGLIPALVPKSGVTVEAVLRSRTKPPAHGCTITLTDLSSGRVLNTFTQWRKTAFDAADAAAICAVAHILDRDPLRRRTPNWSRFGWRSRNALGALTKGDDLIAGIDSDDSARQRYEEAIEQYKAALRHDPSSLSIAMKLGAAQEVLAGKKEGPQEKAEQILEAAETYLRVRTLWSYAYAPRYRAAIALAACAEHFKLIQGDLTKLDLPNQKRCRRAADEILEDLVDNLGWGYVMARWLETFFKRRDREAGTRRYFQRFVNPFSRERIEMRTAYEMARPVVCNKPADKQVERLLCEKIRKSRSLRDILRAWRGVNWQVRYNAACYYSRRAKKATGAEKASLLGKADELLIEVLHDPRHEVTGAWLRRDPDLDPLHNWIGGGWKDVNVVSKRTLQASPST